MIHRASSVEAALKAFAETQRNVHLGEDALHELSGAVDAIGVERRLLPPGIDQLRIQLFRYLDDQWRERG